MFIKELLDQMWVMPALVTTGSSVAIVATSKWHGAFSHDHSEGVQKFHTAPTPRIGGLAILIGLLAAWATLSGSEAHLLLGMMLLAGLPAFVMGFAEDLTKRVGVNARLLATIVSGIAACFFTGYSLTHIDIWGIDALLLIPLLSVAFTAFAVGGVANSVNIIDGFNGLAGGTLAICFTAMGFIAHSVGDTELTTISLALVIVLAGFLVVNFPFGKLFLGDGGAYLLGFLLAWMAVMLPMRNPSVSVWAPLVICAYPFNETIYSMARRYLNKSNPGEPDSEHLHSLIKIKIIRRHFSSLPQSLRNGLVSPICWIGSAVSAVAAIMLYQRTDLLMIAWAISFGLYTLMYRYLIKLPTVENTDTPKGKLKTATSTISE